MFSIQATSLSTNSNCCVRSGVVTAYSVPNRSLLICSSVRLVLINGSEFRHTIFSAISQLSSIPISSEFLPCCRLTHTPVRGNNHANHKSLKMNYLRDKAVAEFRKFTKFRNHASSVEGK